MFLPHLTIPLQLVCQLVTPGNIETGNAVMAHRTDHQLLLNQATALPKQVAALPKQVAALPKQVAALPKQVAALPKQVAALPAESLRVLPDGYTAFVDIEMAYKYHPQESTWDEARKYCISTGSTLAVIDTAKKIQYAMTLKEAKRNLHLGIHRYFNNTEWISVRTGLRLETIPWAVESNVAQINGLCMRMWHDGRGLIPNDCHSKLHFICEIPFTSN